MRSVFFALCVVAVFAQANAQVVVDSLPWAPKAAIWVYKSFSPTSNLYYKFTYDKDTVVQQRLVKLLSVYRIEYIGFGNQTGRTSQKIDQEYVYESNDSIFWFDKLNTRFSFIYSFSSSAGDSLLASNSRARCNGNSSFPISDTLMIDSTYTDTFSNRVFVVQSTTMGKQFTLGNIVANVGSLLSPFPQINRMICPTSTAEFGDFYEGLVCYSDSLRGSVQFSFMDTMECYSISTGLNEIGNNSSNDFYVYPNPSSNVVWIGSTAGYPLEAVFIYSVEGNLISSQNISTNKIELDISGLSKGMYFVKLVGSDKSPYSLRRFVKN